MQLRQRLIADDGSLGFSCGLTYLHYVDTGCFVNHRR